MLDRDPVILYGPGGKIKSIPAVDAPGWLGAGWSLEEGGEEMGGWGDGEMGENDNPSTPKPSVNTSSKRKKAESQSGGLLRSELSKTPFFVENDGDGNTLPES